MKNDHTTTTTARPGRFRRLAAGGALAVVASAAAIVPATAAFAGGGTPTNPYIQICQDTHTACDAEGYPLNVDKGAIIAHCGYLPPPFADCDGAAKPKAKAPTPPPTQAPKVAPRPTTPPPTIHQQSTPDVPVAVRPNFTG